MDNDNSISQLLSMLLMALIFILFLLIIIYVVLRLKNKAKEKKANQKKVLNDGVQNTKKEKKSKSNKNSVAYNKKSIFDFMEFDDIQDNMIIQKKGKRFLTVIECIGVNYDLMSRMEKNSVEEGFQQFLNTLRHPIQIFIQTRTMNLEKSIQNYQQRVNVVEERYRRIQREYNRMKESMAYSKEDMDKALFELTRAKNLLEYGKDIIANTERMSLNKNVLTKKYYIVVPYFAEDTDKYDSEEIKSMAFSELYTKAQAIIATLSACSITGKILDSQELVELMYMTYNREEADTYGIEKALRAEYDSLYSTAPDVYEQKLKILDDEINQRAIELANRKIEQAKSIVQEKAEEKAADMDLLAMRMAEIFIKDNKKYVGEEVADEAVKLLNEEGGETNVGQKEKTRRRTKK